MSSAIWASPGWRTALLALALPPLLAGCAFYSKPVIQESVGNAAGMREVAILSNEEDVGLRVRFREHLQSAFRARGVPSNDAAEVVGDFAISTMSNNMSLASSLPSANTPGGAAGVKVQSAQRNGGILDDCDSLRYRASLVLFNRNSGERIHRAEVESRGCESQPIPLNDLADLLVRDALLAPL